MLRFKNLCLEIEWNYHGKLLDPISDLLINSKDVDSEVYQEYINSGEYVELPLNDFSFRKEFYDKFIVEYILVHYAKDVQMKKQLKYLENTEGTNYDSQFRHLCEEMNLRSEYNDFHSKILNQKVEKWCSDNNIAYYK